MWRRASSITRALPTLVVPELGIFLPHLRLSPNIVTWITRPTAERHHGDQRNRRAGVYTTGLSSLHIHHSSLLITNDPAPIW